LQQHVPKEYLQELRNEYLKCKTVAEKKVLLERVYGSRDEEVLGTWPTSDLAGHECLVWSF
jgi:hypothetical protein